jgi:hypothetical protein
MSSIHFTERPKTYRQRANEKTQMPFIIKELSTKMAVCWQDNRGRWLKSKTPPPPNAGKDMGQQGVTRYWHMCRRAQPQGKTRKS